MTTYVIKLASNFQTVEFNLELEPEDKLTINDPRISDAVELVNKLGEVVENTIKTKQSQTTTMTKEEKVVEELATEGQKKYLKGLKIDFDEKTLTKKEAWKILQDHKRN